MSFTKKPKLFEDLTDNLLDRLPVTYRLMESGSIMGLEYNEALRDGAIMPLEPFHRPISRVLIPTEEEA